MCLLCCLRRPLILEAGAVSAKYATFARKSSSWRGEEQRWEALEQTTGHAINISRAKWDVEYRVYFVKDVTIKSQLEQYGFTVDDGKVRCRGSYRINSEVLLTVRCCLWNW